MFVVSGSIGTATKKVNFIVECKKALTLNSWFRGPDVIVDVVEKIRRTKIL
jgi:hypothetical protein